MVLWLVLLAITPAAATAGVIVHTSEEILADWTTESGGRLFFQDADSQAWEFVTDIEDPVIANKGQGRFFPADEAEVRRAVEAITFSLRNCDIEIFLLPYPRRGLLKSSAGFQAIYISPGVAAYATTQLHSLISHEIGHLVHNRYMDTAGEWHQYRALRGIQDEAIYFAAAMHRDRPHEIFAEDFRYLFGGELANYSHSIENQSLALPDAVPGLRNFFLSLLGGGPSVGNDLPLRGRLSIFPNPTFSGVSVSFAQNPSLGSAVDLRVYDVRGRLVAEQLQADSATLRWEGNDRFGSQAPAGIYFVQVRRQEQTWVGKVMVSR